MNFKVRLEFTLIGMPQRSKHEALMMNSREAHECMLEQVRFHFGKDRPIYMSNKIEKAADAPTYPKFYAAGWFWRINESDQGNETYDSELVIITHGDSLKDANKNLIAAVSNVPWDDFAKTM